MDQVLRNPELLTIIFGMICQDDQKRPAHRKPSLAPLARVNSTWRDLVDLILLASPDVAGLASIMNKRRQQYASHIRTLDFRGRGFCTTPELVSLFANLQYPRIKRLVLGHGNLNFKLFDPRRYRPLAKHEGHDIPIIHYFQETLEDLKLLLWDSICTASLFVQITKRCPRLKRVSFSAIGTQLQPEDLLDFFRASSHLESIELRLGPEPGRYLITGDLLLRFSRMTKLKHLLIDNELNQPDLFWTIK